tara:strand:+ start:150 stop:596 length:447 start_codon:yes stop_codon:yes gene_type:complete
MNFDFSGMSQAMDRMRDNAESQGKTLAEKMSSEFLKEIKEQSWQIAPTPQEITAKARELKFRLKRKPGVTPKKELARRIRARGTFARKWKFWKTENKKYSIRIWLIDTSADSGRVDEEKKVSAKAEKITGKKYKSKLDRMASKIFNGF